MEESPRCWRLINKPTDKQGLEEEIVVRVQGILAKKDLPPFTTFVPFTFVYLFTFTNDLILKKDQFFSMSISQAKRHSHRSQM